MDDPSIAERLGRTALDAAGSNAPALTYRVEASDHDTGPGEGRRSPRGAERSAGWGAALGVLVMSLAGAAAGWWLSPRLAGEPETWMLAGAGIGLVVSWLGLRWAHKTS